LEELQNRIAQLEEEKSKLNPNDSDDIYRIRQINAEIDQINIQIAQIGTQQDREQKKVDDLQDITLPQDYNSIFGDHRANDEITNLIRQVKEQLWNQHNDELGELDASYRSQVADLNQNLTLVQAERDILSQDKEEMLHKADDAAASIHALTLRAEDAESKRDAAAREIVSLKGQINELEQTISATKKPSGTGGFSFTLTSGLPKESGTDKAARLKSEETERINANLARFGVAPLTIPATEQQIKEQTATVAEAAADATSFPSVVQSDTTGQTAQAGAGEAVADDSVTAQTLEERVAKLEVQLRVAREDIVLLEEGISADIKRLEESVFGKSVIEEA
jgi:uncharacterized coiled-coil DUF342 family protein